MTFDDPAFDFIPWAQPLSDPRKARITVKQLLNHTSGICPEATGAPNDGSWEYILGHTGDARTEKLAFDPGTACGYSTHAWRTPRSSARPSRGSPTTSSPSKRYSSRSASSMVVSVLRRRAEDGPSSVARAGHARARPRPDRLLHAHDGRWNDQQVIPKWFVAQTAAPTHDVKGPEMRFKINAQIFSHGWELPRGLTGEAAAAVKGFRPTPDPSPAPEAS